MIFGQKIDFPKNIPPCFWRTPGTCPAVRISARISSIMHLIKKKKFWAVIFSSGLILGYYDLDRHRGTPRKYRLTPQLQKLDPGGP